MKISTGISLVSLFKALSGGSFLPAPKIADIYTDAPFPDPINNPFLQYVDLVTGGTSPTGDLLYPTFTLGNRGPNTDSYTVINDTDNIIEIYDAYAQEVSTDGYIRLKAPGLYNITQYAYFDSSNDPVYMHLGVYQFDDAGYVGIPWMFANENIKTEAASPYFTNIVNKCLVYIDQSNVNNNVIIEEWIENANPTTGSTFARVYEYSIRVEYYPL